MLDQRRVATQPDEKRERLFTERYESLLAWALRLTNHQRDAAEDLVQDAFVQFMLGRTRLEEIENIDGYLRRMLRYMHVSRISRSAQHLHESALSVADYDSCRLGWSAIEPPRRVQASEELHQICAYACSRKESSRAGSVLILRFFHEYFPTEIAAVLNSSRHSVDELQRFARREAKLFMDEPGRLRFVNKTGAERQQFKYLKSEGDLMFGLRQIIFDSCKGECIPKHELEEAYAKGDGEALTTARLAHIVSCPQCLDAVNSLLGLPLLAERYEAGSSDSKEPPRDADGGGASGGGTGDLPKKFGKRLREIHEHKPQELRISVNGFLVSSLTVSSDLNEVNLNLTPDAPIEFVEVCSEQGVPLLFFTIDPVGPESEQWAWIELSEGRFLEASFYNENEPSLHVIYKDPVAEEAFDAGENALSSPLFVVPEPKPADGRTSTQRGNFRLRSWTRWLIGLFRRRVVAEENSSASNDAFVQSLDDGFRENNFLTLMGQSTNRNQSRRRLGLFVMLASAALIAGLLFFKASLAPALTATALLESARVTEQAKQQIPDKVRHRSIRLEERRSAEGAIVAQRRIEIWENRATGNRAQRLYDDSNRLIAGAWEKPDGSRTVYQHGSKPQSQPRIATPDNLLLNLEDVWQLDPSPETFRALIAEPALADVEERSTTYVITYEKVRTIGASRLLKATLTLTKSDLHPIEQTLLVQRGNESREYRFGEANDELLPMKAAAFEIEPELVGGAREPGRTGDWALRDLTTSRVPPTPSTSTPPAASAELEVDVAYLLNQAKADLNEQVALTRSAGGSLRVEGVVDTQQRKEQFLRALAPVSNNPAVVIAIRTVAEATVGRTAAGPVIVQETEETANTVAADEELRAYFTKKNQGPVDEAIRSYSSQVVNRAYSALFHAIELKKLIDRFANVDMRTVAPDARAKWLSMIRQHASAFAHENALLRQEIQPIFFSGSSLHGAEEFSIQNDAELARAVERLHRLALQNNAGIRSAFLISSHSSAVAIKSGAFWQSLHRAEHLAESVMAYQSSSN